VAFRSDPYKRDTSQLALADTGGAAASR
jgi:hypothetical protein